jgi:hypothetical protein
MSFICNKSHLEFVVVVVMSLNVNLLLLTLIFLCGDQGAIMDNLPRSPSSSFFLPMHVEQQALHSIQ